MSGYLNRFIHLDFPELGGETADGRAYVWVKIRNPRLMPGADLLGGATISVGPDGMPVDSGAATEQTFAMMSKLVIAGNVWDPSWIPEDLESDEPGPLLPMPPTPDVVAKMPMAILNRIGEELKKANPK